MASCCSFKFSSFTTFVILIAVSTQWVVEDCETPTQEPGSCMSIYSCKPMMEIFDNLPQDVTAEANHFLKSFICGFTGKTPNVCCPFSQRITLPATLQLKLNVDSPPNVDNHKNVKLLPTDECGIITSTERIVYGNTTGVFEFPWTAMLWYTGKKGPKFRCGGTIINNRYILTAAHCINEKLIKVRVGEHDVRTVEDCEEEDGEEICADPYKELQIENITIHKLYRREASQHDIALLRVSPMKFSESIRPICLPLGSARTFNLTNRYGVVTGFGSTETGLASPALLKAELPIIPLEVCQEKYQEVAKWSLYKDMATVTHLQLCASGNNLSNFCDGDSGGPFQIPVRLYGDLRYVQLGIVSLGPTKCGLSDGLPGIYAKVVYYMQWILDNIQP